MQNSMTIDAMQVRPAGINLGEGINALKCETKKLWNAKSETFSYLCDERVTYGDVALTTLGLLLLGALMAVSGYLFGGEVM